MRQEQFLSVLDRDEADRRFREALAPLVPRGEERIPLSDALGRVLARDVASPVDVPGFDRSNVDGYAVQSASTFGAMEHAPKRLKMLPGAVQMGKAPTLTVGPGEALSIPTGGVVPRGADAVVMVEHTSIDGDSVLVTKAVAPGRFVTFAGTDVAQGEVILRAKTVLSSRETGVLAAMGIAEVTVFRRPRIAILSTGDEIVAPGSPILPGQTFDSNAIMVAGAVRENGGEPTLCGAVPDDEDLLRKTLLRLLGQGSEPDADSADFDMVILSGGTSKGPGDLNVRVLSSVLRPPGVVAHGVALKPGKPLCLAASGDKAVVVLPGFPTSAIFTFHELVAPVIRLLSGLSEEGVLGTRAKLPFRVASEIGRTEYVLVRLTENEAADLIAYPIGKGSGSVTTWTQADGYFVIPKRVEQLDSNETVLVRPLGGRSAHKADLVVIGSHCVGLDILFERLGRRGLKCKLIATGSEGGLSAVRRGECDVAGMHLYDAKTGTYNEPFVGPGLVLIRGYGRLQGVVFRPGDQRFEGKDAAQAVSEVVRDPTVVMVNRNRGSGTRAIVDKLLGDARPQGYAVEASSHHAIAAAVAQRRADFGVAIDIVANDRHLGFLPVAEERFDFVAPVARKDKPAVIALIEELASPETRSALFARGLRP